MPATDDVQHLLRRGEAAKRLALSISQLDRLVRARKIGVVRVGRSVRFTEGALCDFIDAHGAAPTQPPRRRAKPSVVPVNRHRRTPPSGNAFRDALD